MNLEQLKYFHFFQYLALFSAIYFYKSLKIYRAGAMLPLLILVCLIETWSAIIKTLGYVNKHYLYNILIFSSTPLYFYLFYYFLNIKERFRKIYIYTSVFISLAFLYNFCFFEGIMKFNTLSIILLSFFTTLLSILLLFKLAVSENYFILSKHPYFWIAAGLLVFSLGTLVVLGMNQFIRINNLTIVNKALYRTIMPVLNVILYSSFTYAFYLCAQTKKSYSPL